MDYNTLRHFADSWVLVAMTLLFAGIVIYVLRPGARKKYDDDAKIPLKED